MKIPLIISLHADERQVNINIPQNIYGASQQNSAAVFCIKN